MPATLLALQILLILLPGLSAAYFVQGLATRRLQSDTEKLVEALVFSFVIYVCYMALNHGHLPFQVVADATGKGDPSIVWQPAQLGSLAATTAVFALIALVYIRFDGNRLFRLLRLTERTTGNSIWNDIFEHEAIDDQPVQVELGDGRSVLGVLLYYSDSSDEASVYLKDAAWVDAEGGTIPIPGPGILLTKSADIRSVSLLNPIE